MSAIMQEKLLVTDLKNGVKVRAEWPHLVSFGGGRLSTAVTILPLKEGLTTLGTASDCDIAVAGTGVENEHCHVHNDDGVVILTPVTEDCHVTIDGMKIERPTILSQGCMICIGRSNYFRFNHPEQAAQLRNILPANSRVSVVPLQFGCNTTDPKSFPASDTRAPAVSAMASGKGGDSTIHATALVGETEESFVSSKLKRFEALSLTKSEEGCQARDSKPLLPSDRCLDASTEKTGDSGKPEYLSYVSEKLFAHCTGGIVSQPTHSTILDGFFRERSDSNLSSSSSCSDSSSSSSNSSWTSCEPTQRSHAENVSDACPRPLSLLRRRGGGGGRLPDASGRAPLYDIKTLSMVSTETSVWGSTSSVATTLVDDSDGMPLTPLGGRLCMDDVFSNGDVEDDEDEGTHDSSLGRQGLASLCQALAPGAPRSIVDALWHEHNRSVEERRRAQEVEQREQRRFDDILRMCAEYERQADGELRAAEVLQPQSKQGRDPWEVQRGGVSIASSAESDRLREGAMVADSMSSAVSRLLDERNAAKVKAQAPSVATTDTAKCTEGAGSCRIRSRPDEHSDSEVGAHLSHGEAALSLSASKLSTNGSMLSQSGEELIYDTLTSADVPAAGPPKTAAEARRAVAGSTHQDGERIYDDPAAYVAVDVPPVPARLRTAAQAVGSMPPALQLQQRVIEQMGATSGQLLAKVHDASIQIPSMQNGPANGKQQEQHKLACTAPAAAAQSTDSKGQLQLLISHRREISDVLSKLRNSIADAERRQEAIIRQFEIERARMEAEQKEELDQLHLQTVESCRIKARQLAALERISREQEEEAAKVERARCRMEAVEQRRRLLQAEQAKRAQKGGAGAEDSSAVDYYTSELEQIDNELKDFEDLEFQQLEVETKFEEEKEEAQRELGHQQVLMQDSVSAAEERLEAHVRRHGELLQRVKAESEAGERRHLALVAEFRSQKERLLATDKQIRDLEVSLASQSSSKDTSSFSMTVSLEDNLTWTSPGDAINKALLLRLKADESALIEARRKLDDIKMAVAACEVARAPALGRASSSLASEQQRNGRNWNGCMELEESSVKSSEALSEADKTSFTGSDDLVDRRGELQHLLMEARAHVENADNGTFTCQNDVTAKSESEASSRSQLDMSALENASINSDEVRLREKNQTLQDRPLTRYLPARAEILDLRAHVESAGHNVEACRHVNVDAKTCRGYLLKMGYRMKSWNKRWFIFNREKKSLTYYMDKHDSKPRGIIPFHAIEDVFVDHLNAIKTPHHKPMFCVKTVERPYHLIAKTPETMSIWIDVIFSGAEGYREF